jgi:alkaline phosphatase D
VIKNRVIFLFKVFALTLLNLYFTQLKAQDSKILAKPIVGSVTENSAKVWVAYKESLTMRLVLMDTISKMVTFPSNSESIKSSDGTVAAIGSFERLQPNTTYFVFATLDEGRVFKTTSFKTLSDNIPHQISFTLGSCALMETGFFRGAFPGASSRIFKKMEAAKPDFNVWLGDNVYYFGHHYNSFDNMFYRWLKIRSKFKTLNNFLSSVPQYAIWDDHDFGPNDSGKNFKLKDSALIIFKHFWPNDYPNQSQLKGNYFTFRKHDIEFFMTDDRFYRDAPCDSCDFLGETQLIWLKNKLMLSDATFKFICMGTQLLNTNGFGESYDQYKREQQDLINFITSNNIKGVVFLTGDKHYSEVCRREINGYPVYDFTCSPLTTMALPRKLLGAYNNGDRVSGSDYAKKNFGKISITGKPSNRVCEIEIFSVGGKLKRKIIIEANQLQKK